MPKESLTHIAVILDRSGSMDAIRDDVVGGFNNFLKEQQEAPGDCTLTLVQFDTADPYEVLRDMVPVKEVMPLGDEYQPRAGTPLYDAVGRGIVTTGEQLSKLPEEQRPGKVVFVIITDGQENSSQEYTKAKVAEMTKHQTEAYKWDFVYLGANQDAMVEGAKFGVGPAMAASYSPGKVGTAMRTASSKMSSYRSSGDKNDLNFTDDERIAMS
jgi:uncharacterized protein YxeA